MIGNSVFVQGTFVEMLANGRMVVQLDGRIFSGTPVQAAA